MRTTGQRGVAGAPLRDLAEQQAAVPAVALGTEHQQVGVLGGLDQHLVRTAVADPSHRVDLACLERASPAATAARPCR